LLNFVRTLEAIRILGHPDWSLSRTNRSFTILVFACFRFAASIQHLVSTGHSL
jgi:hypothetical protein